MSYWSFDLGGPDVFFKIIFLLGHLLDGVIQEHISAFVI